MRSKAWIVLAVIAVVSIVIAGTYLLSRPADSAQLVLSGNIEVVDVSLSFKIPGRLQARLVDEGELLSAGQLIAQLENADQSIAVAQAEANVALAQAVLAELEAGSRPQQISQAGAQVAQARAALIQLERGSREQEIAAARAEVERAEAGAEQARLARQLTEADFRRSSELYDYGVIPRQQFDSAQTAYDTSQRVVKAAEASVASALERLSLAREGPRAELIDQARAALGQAQANYELVAAGPRAETIEQAAARLRIAGEQLNQARQQLAYTELRSPIDGVVLSKAAEPGEYLNPGTPVLSAADLNRVWLRAYINETDLGRIKLGQAAEISTDTYPGRVYQGRVSYIASEAEFTPKQVQTFAERVKLVYLVKLELDNPAGELKPGMPADAVIQLPE
jgi:HlyD family secretion protein